jgi:hypothetical protein
MVATQAIAAIRNRLTFIADISFQSGMTSAMADPVDFAVRSMPMLRTAAFNLRESISPAVSVKRLASRGDN